MNQLTKPFTRLTPEQWQQIIDQQMAGGLSQKAFCQTQNISLATFTNWKRKLQIHLSPGTVPRQLCHPEIPARSRTPQAQPNPDDSSCPLRPV